MNNESELFFKGPYEVNISEKLGRFLIASRDIEERELIICEKPIVSGPADEETNCPEDEGGSGPMCLGCYRRLPNGSWIPCRNCGWPVCGIECENADHHAQNECQVFQSNNVAYPCRHITSPVVNKSILVLRTLLLKRKCPSLWEKVILKLEHHTEIRQSKAYCVKSDMMILENLSDFLSDCGFEFEDDVIQISGIINVNAFSAMKSDFQGNCVRIVQCIYSQASLMAHSCIPNACWSIDVGNNELKISIRAAVPIKKGEMITIAYNVPETMRGTLHRLISTEDVAHFICSCNRCMDPTEMGTFVSAIKCFDCEVDYLLPKYPLVPESVWQCPRCSHSHSVEKIVLLLSQIEDAFENIKRQRCSRETEIRKLETLVRVKGRLLLHENHYILQAIRMRIISTQIHSLEELTDNELDGLIHHCKVMLSIADVLMPGFNRTRALLQFFIAQGLIRKMEIRDQFSRKSSIDSQGEEELDRVVKDTHNTVYYLQTRALLFFSSHNNPETNSTRSGEGGAAQYINCIQRQLKKCNAYFRSLEN